jgi:hypothetical protein
MNGRVATLLTRYGRIGGTAVAEPDNAVFRVSISFSLEVIETVA